MENLYDLFQNFTLTDSIDIVIVSFIIYKFFSIIQGTRAVQILVGTAFITTLYWVSLTFEMYSLSWILRSFFDYFFVIMIILFQEQIRNALALVGEARFFSKKKKSFYDFQIEEVVTACSALSRERTGAIIVFEKLNGLLNYSSTGTKLDSKIHSDIIYSLFQSTSPLHDGALVLFQNRIQAAGCYLPLSKNIELDRQFGTRHRAALGVTEITDAVVVTVSEESGNINVFYKGKFFACEDEVQMRKQLRSSLYSARVNLVMRREGGAI